MWTAWRRPSPPRSRPAAEARDPRRYAVCSGIFGPSRPWRTRCRTPDLTDPARRPSKAYHREPPLDPSGGGLSGAAGLRRRAGRPRLRGPRDERARGLPSGAPGSGDLRRARHADRPRRRGRNAAHRLGVGALARRQARLRGGRAVAGLRAAHQRDRDAGAALRQRLPGRASALVALRALPDVVHAGDAGHRAGRRPGGAVRVLGVDHGHLLPADRLRPRPIPRPADPPSRRCWSPARARSRCWPGSS